MSRPFILLGGTMLSFETKLPLRPLKGKFPPKATQSNSSSPRIIGFELSLGPYHLTPRELLKVCGIPDGANPKQELIQQIDARAAELPLPDGCAVVDFKSNHTQVWNDVLTVLAVICKSSTNIWLRSKTTNLTLIQERMNISLVTSIGSKA